VVARKLLVLITPLLLTPAFLFLIAEGILSFGAGEKDLVLVIPWFVWSVLFLIAGLTLWKKNLSNRHWLTKSFFYSLVVLMGIWLSLLVYSLISTI
jgi:heme O synthase-like polyprenyltransferase